MGAKSLMTDSTDSKDRQFLESEAIELREWMESIDYVFYKKGPERVRTLLEHLYAHLARKGMKLPFSANTPYINTIPLHQQMPFPGSRAMERRIKSLIRWNAMAMVVRANREAHGIGGHISTYASAAALYEVGFNHFFRARDKNSDGDSVYFQGHASPGIYARAFLENRISKKQLENFRRELSPDGGLSSYPHPWLMEDFWQFPTVSMGLSPIMGIYQARFNRYLEHRGLKDPSDAKVWVFVGDGETDEPESLGAITLASREGLDNLIFVVNCNLQRLDGPVRGNGKIIQELEAAFRGAGWNVIKVIFGSSWDPLFEQDKEGLLIKRLGELVDGEYQRYTIETGAYIRKHLFKGDPRLAKLAEHMSDEELEKLMRGGHDPDKIYNAYRAACLHKGSPSVILAKTVKGYGLGEAGEGRNITHQQKKLNEEELRAFRSRFSIPLADEDISGAPFYKPAEDSMEIRYIHKCRKKLKGYVPSRQSRAQVHKCPPRSFFKEFFEGTEGREVSTTMVYVRLLARLLKDRNLGKYIVPIIPDEARTFGMESLFGQFGIYSSKGQLYDPVDSGSLLFYREAKDGQILEEGITEAGAMASFIAAGTAYSTHGISMIPFFTYYSMFGFQRIGDLIWAAGDMRCRGFMIGGTAGRTTLSGEGLQHQDGHSHLLAYGVPNLLTYDPAFAYELAVIIREGIRRMYVEQEDIFYYLTVENENYSQPPMPKGVEEGIIKGLYLYKASEHKDAKLRAQLFGSGAILNEVLKAQETLWNQFNVAADVWSVTSYKALRHDALSVERWNMLHPTKKPRMTYIGQCLAQAPGVCVAASDYLKALPDSVARWFPKAFYSLGTDGFGRSDTRVALRDFFEVDEKFLVLATLYSLAREQQIEASVVQNAIKILDIDPKKVEPVSA